MRRQTGREPTNENQNMFHRISDTYLWISLSPAILVEMAGTVGEPHA